MPTFDPKGEADLRLLQALAESMYEEQNRLPEHGIQPVPLKPRGAPKKKGLPPPPTPGQSKVDEIRQLRANMPPSYMDEFNGAVEWAPRNNMVAPSEEAGIAPLSVLMGMFPEFDRSERDGMLPVGLNTTKLSPQALAEWQRRRQAFEQARSNGPTR